MTAATKAAATFTAEQALALAETAWSETVPTAEEFDGAGGTAYVWYYIKGDDTHSDTDPVCVTSLRIGGAGVRGNQKRRLVSRQISPTTL